MNDSPLTAGQWGDLWWGEFKRLRKEFPTRDLVVLQKATTTYMVKRYGYEPSVEPSIKDKVIRALALRWLRGKVSNLRGKDRETGMGKLLKFLDGWKLVIFTLVLFASRIYDAANNGHTGDIVGAVVAALGLTPDVMILDPAALGAAAAGALAIWGVFSRVYKAQKQVRAGSSVAGALSTEGYVSQAVSESMTSAKKGAALAATIAKAETVGDAKATAAAKQ